MLDSLFDVLTFEPERSSYLQPFIDLAQRQNELTIATLNYDRTVETAASQAGIECNTGIDTWLSGGQFDLPDKGLLLLKLHGSIDWVVAQNRQLTGGALPQTDIETLAEPVGQTARSVFRAKPAVVFGAEGKLRAEGPFLELLMAWATRLRNVDSLIVVGYSFRDPHINEIVARWFNSSDHRRIVLVDPAEPPRGWAAGTAPPFSHLVARLKQPRFAHVQGGAAAGGITGAILAAEAPNL